MERKVKIIQNGTTEAIFALGPAIRALRSLHPDAEIHLETNETSLEAASLLPDLDGYGIIGSGPAQPDFTYQLEINEQERGLESIDWLCYTKIASQLRLGNPFHSIDLNRKSIQADAVDVNYELKRPELAESSVNALLNDAHGLKVAICAASLGQEEIEAILASLHHLPLPCEVFCIGTIKDRKISGAFKQNYQNTQFHDLCGQVSLLEAAQLFLNCDISICGPGASALISSGYGTFTVCLDRRPECGPLYYPYGHGHLVVQAQDQGLFSTDLPDILSGILRFTLTGNSGMIPSILQWEEYFNDSLEKHLGRVRICATQRVEVPLENSGALTELRLKPLVYLGAEYHDTMQAFYRLLWEMSLSARSLETQELEVLHQDTIPALCELLKPLEQLYELARFGVMYCEQITQSLSQGVLPQAKQSSERLQEVDDLIRSIGSAYGGLEAICEYHLLRQRYISEDNPILLASLMKQSYSDLQSRVLVLLDLKRSLFHTNLREGSSLLSGTTEEGMSNG